MIVDASVVIDAVADSGPRGAAARLALRQAPADEVLHAPGHFAFEVMSGLSAAAHRPAHPFRATEIPQALQDAEALGIRISPTPWMDVHRAWRLAQQSIRYTDAIYVAAAERRGTALLTSDARIERSGATIGCRIITVTPTPPKSEDTP